MINIRINRFTARVIRIFALLTALMCVSVSVSGLAPSSWRVVSTQVNG
jgi:hypothetical protein